ncbi:trans-sialidase [Trypanosoma cruzi]|nr:trans-sialidase [Trypanosoma cruzi]
MLSFYFVTGQCDGAPCACCLRSHRHVLKWSASFCEESSVCQRDRETRLAVAGVPPGTAPECRVPRVGRSPGWGRLSGIAPSLLLNAVVVVDGKLLMGERECACHRVISRSGNSLELCMRFRLTDVVFWIPISRYSVAQQ